MDKIDVKRTLALIILMFCSVFLHNTTWSWMLISIFIFQWVAIKIIITKDTGPK